MKKDTRDNFDKPMSVVLFPFCFEKNFGKLNDSSHVFLWYKAERYHNT